MCITQIPFTSKALILSTTGRVTAHFSQLRPSLEIDLNQRELLLSKAVTTLGDSLHPMSGQNGGKRLGPLAAVQDDAEGTT